MIEFTIDTQIARPVSEVFAYVTDPGKLATWQTNTVSVRHHGRGALGLGSRLEEIHRAPGGREVASTVEVVEFDRDRTFALHMLDGALPIDAHISFEPTATGTQMRFTAHGQPRRLARLAEPLLRLVLRRQLAGYCGTLKQILEGRPPRAGGAA
jgi:uncharacterized protein YndB with AHSA1/START domain